MTKSATSPVRLHLWQWLGSSIRRLLRAYPEFVAVVVAAGVGLSVQRPLAWTDRHQGINVALAVLVFTTAVTVDAASFTTLRSSRWRLFGALVLGITVLPGLSWTVAQIVPVGGLREGVMVMGLAPCEIASVATTRMARGQPALSAVLLVGSTALTVALAGPILTLEASTTKVHPGHIVSNLAVVVALPLAAGMVLRGRWPEVQRVEPVTNAVATAAVAILVGLIAAEVHLGLNYFSVLGASLLFLVGSAALGLVLGLHGSPPAGVALLLTTSMRDFAIAAGLATAAFGTAAAAPLGLYGIVVLVWGTAVAGVLRSRAAGL